MATSIRASTVGLELVDKARRTKGWTKTAQVWVDLACTSPATLKRFWSGISINSDTFQDICEAVGVENWESIADWSNWDNTDKSRTNTDRKRLNFAIAGSIEKIDKGKLDAIVALLQKLTGDTEIEILDIEEGSIRLILGGSPEALERIVALFNSGELTEVVGIPVEDVHILGKEELIDLIKRNSGADQNLIGADLSRADLGEANLRKADLRDTNLKGTSLEGSNLGGANLEGANLEGANLKRTDLEGVNLTEANLMEANLMGTNLRRANLELADLMEANLMGTNLELADLTEANLMEANLRRANLRRANLRRANLGGANLGGANLEEANLERANLEEANLEGANVLNADFTKASSLEEEEKIDLERRGAIFRGPGSSDRSRVHV